MMLRDEPVEQPDLEAVVELQERAHQVRLIPRAAGSIPLNRVFKRPSDVMEVNHDAWQGVGHRALHHRLLGGEWGISSSDATIRTPPCSERDPAKGVCADSGSGPQHGTKKSGYPDKLQVYKRAESATPRRRFTTEHPP